MASGELSLRARAFLVAICGTGAGILAWASLTLDGETRGWVTFAILGTGAAAAQLFPVLTPRHNAFTVSVVFTVPGVFLLPVPLLVLLPIVQLVPEWLKQRYPWYMVSFNASNWMLNLLAGWGVAHAIHDRIGGNAGLAIAAVAAAATIGILNHLVIAVMITLTRDHTLRSTGMLTFESLSNEVTLNFVGVSLAMFWEWNPWLVPIALAPLVLIQRSLAVESLKEEARVDPKTGLFNARHFASAFADELGRAVRFDRPLSLIMADLDLLRDINNTYGHLAGDAVLRGIADVFRGELRQYDVPARFGGEEFSILLPETSRELALEIAERIRREIAASEFEVETSDHPIHATVSIGVATFPEDGDNANELIHQADLAVYRAKLQGRNRILAATSEPLLVPADRTPRLAAVPDESQDAPAAPAHPKPELKLEPSDTRQHAVHGPRFVSLSSRLGALVGGVSVGGIAAGVLGLAYGSSSDVIGMIAVVVLVAVGQALALEYDDTDASLSVSAVGALAGAALFGPRTTLALALAIVLVDWSARRPFLYQSFFNLGTLSLSTLAAVGVFDLASGFPGNIEKVALCAFGVIAGGAYFLINMGVISLALAVEGHDSWPRLFRERFSWLLPHYLVYGFIGGVISIAYEAVGLYALGVFALPLLLMRKTQEAYLKHTQRSAQKLRAAAETIQSQNVSLEQANRLLRERSTAAMESLSATVDARDAYTAGHSRRVQQLALSIGRELGLSQAELDLLGHAALFHDIGKLAVPDAILLKPASLTLEEWALMQRHAEEGASIIDRLGFLQDAVPAIRHHHERFDGTGYPDGLRGEEIPLGARIIHVADALDSMLTTRIYQAARPVEEALDELQRGAGSQFCPRCVSALERVLPVDIASRSGRAENLLGVAS